MRIVTWNCFKGECRERAAQLAALSPDLVVLQECGMPTDPQDDRCLWFGPRPAKGVGVVATGGLRLAPGHLHPAVPDSAFPVVVTGRSELHVLAVWAQRRPTYIGSLFDAVQRYREFLLSAPSVIVGDFNSHPRWDRDDLEVNHSRLVEMLQRYFGLVSACHASPGREDSAPEDPTLYWQWKQHQPYHIDYCFIPEAWVPHIEVVQVGDYSEWAAESDHRPLMVQIGDAALFS